MPKKRPQNLPIIAFSLRANGARAKILAAVDCVLKFQVYHFLVSNDHFFCDLSSGSASSVPKISQNILPSMAVTMRANGARAKILVAVDRVLKFEVYHFLVSNDQFFFDLSSGSASSVPKISQINLPIIAVSMRANGAQAKFHAYVRWTSID
jgi:hypothetical protein